MGEENPVTPPANQPPANQPPANQPPANQDTSVPESKPPVVVNHTGGTELLNAIKGLPEKLSEVFAEKFPVNPRTAPPQDKPPANQPPANQPPTTPPANQPPAKRAGSRIANWYFGNKS
jgi:hypothetical protein